MSIEDLKKDIRNSKNIKIHKTKNGAGNFSYQYFNGKKWQIGCFKNYEDAITFFYFEGFTKDTHYNNFVVLERE